MFRHTVSTLIFVSVTFTVGLRAHAQTAGNSPLGPFLAESAATAPPERYDVMAVDRAEFLKTEVEIGEASTYPSYTQQLLRVKWRQRDPIDVSIVKPSGAVRPPVVLFLYGYGTDPDKFLNRQFCALLASKGFVSVGFQTALTGPRYHDRPLKKWFVSELQESIGASVHDVQLMIDYLQTRDDLDTSRIGIFGQGSGGAVSILAASVDSRIKAVDVMNPWGDWPDWLAHSPVVPDDERGDYTSPAFLEGVRPLDPLLSMHRLAGRAFRLQQTLFDREVPEAARGKMQGALPENGQYARYADLASYAAGVSHDGRMLDWMQAQLAASTVGRSGPLVSTGDTFNFLAQSAFEQSEQKPSQAGGCASGKILGAC